MTVTAIYLAEKFVPDGRVYNFDFECIGSAAFEFWTEDNQGNRLKIPSNQYTVQFKGRRPIFDGGTVTLEFDPPPQVQQFIAIRNTPIDQTNDFQPVGRFPEVQVEFVLDKLTMICQELNDRVCDRVPGYKPEVDITQLIPFNDYDTFQAGGLNTALDKLATIMQEMVDNKCKEDDLPP